MIGIFGVHSAEEAFERVERGVEGTAFEGLDDVYRDNEDAVEFIVELGEKAGPDSYIGSYESLVTGEDELDFDMDEFDVLLEESEIDILTLIQFGRDVADFQYERVRSRTETDADVISLFSSVMSVDESVVEEMLRSNQDEAVDTLENSPHTVSAGAFSDIISQIQEDWENAGLREFYLDSIQTKKEMFEFIIDATTYEDEPSVGEYFVVTFPVAREHIINKESYDGDFSITGRTEFNIIGKITGREVIDESPGADTMYLFELVSYESLVQDELYSDHWVFDSESMITPSVETDIDLYSENPIGEVQTVVN